MINRKENLGFPFEPLLRKMDIIEELDEKKYIFYKTFLNYNFKHKRS